MFSLCQQTIYRSGVIFNYLNKMSSFILQYIMNQDIFYLHNMLRSQILIKPTKDIVKLQI